MMIHEITEKVGRYPARKRVGRGRGSGKGKTSGRGHKGAKSRSGWGGKLKHEGGQMPIVRRLPMKGFNNARFRREYAILNVQDLELHFEGGVEVSPEAAKSIGIMKKRDTHLKILGKGEVKKAFTVKAHRFSGTAREKIEKAGGTVVEIS